MHYDNESLTINNWELHDTKYQQSANTITRLFQKPKTNQFLKPGRNIKHDRKQDSGCSAKPLQQRHIV